MLYNNNTVTQVPNNEINLARYLIAKSDIEGAVYVLSHVPETNKHKQQLLSYMQQYWPQYFDEDLYYAIQKDDPAEVERDEADVTKQIRWHPLYDFLQERKEISSILDFACSRGLWGCALKKEFSNIKSYTGIDTAIDVIEYAKERVKRLDLTDMYFQFGSHKCLPKSQFDCVLAMEVLEHVPNLIETLTAIEDACKSGGWMFITVPVGAMEYDSWIAHPFEIRSHVREIRIEDWQHLLKDKKEVSIHIGSQCEDRFEESYGQLFVSWSVNDNKRGFPEQDLSSRFNIVPKEIGLIW